MRRSGTDRKWTELSGSRTRPEMFDESGARRKLIIFTEHRDTLNYLVGRLRTWFGRPEAVVAIHGGVPGRNVGGWKRYSRRTGRARPGGHRRRR